MASNREEAHRLIASNTILGQLINNKSYDCASAIYEHFDGREHSENISEFQWIYGIFCVACGRSCASVGSVMYAFCTGHMTHNVVYVYAIAHSHTKKKQ